jgi:hypothetical protein
MAPVSDFSKGLAIIGVALAVYGNVYQKTSRLLGPILMDILYGVTMLLLLLAARTAGGTAVEPDAILCMLGYVLVLLPLNAVAGNLKDFEVDVQIGAQTTAIQLGVVVPEGGGRFVLPTAYRAYVYVTLLLSGAALCSSMVLSREPVWMIVGTTLALLGALAVSLSKIRSLMKHLSEGTMRRTALTRPASVIILFIAFLLVTAIQVGAVRAILVAAGVLLLNGTFGQIRRRLA